MSLTNISKPTTSLSNITRIGSGETWGSITTTWASETRTWAGSGQFVTNVTKLGTLIDSYSESNKGGYQNMFLTGIGNAQGIGQSFTGDGSFLTNAKFYLALAGTPIGTATAALYAHTGTFGTSGKPTGSALATSATFDVSTLTTTPVLVNFTFASPFYQMISGTNYVIAVLYSDAASTSANTVRVGTDSNGTHAGNQSSLSGGVWSASATKDTCFYVYGTKIANLSKPA